jgi:hypothetical protein
MLDLLTLRAEHLMCFTSKTSDGSFLRSFAGDDRLRAEPFDAIDIELGVLWA